MNKTAVALEDFFSKKIAKLSLFSFVISLAVTAILVMLLGKLALWGMGEFVIYIDDEVAVFETIKAYLSSFTLLHYLLSLEFLSIVFDIIIFVNLTIVFYFLFLFTYSIVIAFFAPSFVKYVGNMHYPHVTLRSLSFIFIVLTYGKITLFTVLGIIVFLPLFFIPTLNFLLFVPLYYFFHKSLVLDVSSALNSQKEYKKIKKANRFTLKLHTLFLFLLSLIPLIGIFFIPFYFIYIAHVLFEQTQQLRSIERFYS